MSQMIKYINLGGLMGFGTNCYLLKTDTSYILIDTGYAAKHAVLEKELESAGCRPGNFKLIIMTHGDQDHTGNGAYLRRRYSVKIAMHRYETGVVENGDDTLSRRRMPLLERIFSKIILKVLSLFARFGKFEQFRPDFTIDDGHDLSEYGVDAKVLHIPGHSRGSIGILTNDGSLFCGDLLWNMSRPATHSLVDNPAELKASVEKLKSLKINMVYPGHGKPFPMETLIHTDQ
jgi:hydroxyacylglutathione hydrolase